MNAPMQGPATQPGKDPAAAGNMMEGKAMGEQGGAPKGQDPVIDALKTIQVSIASLQEKGDPKAQGLMDAFKELLQAFQGSPEKEESEEPAEGAQPPAGATPPPAARSGRPMAENQTRGAVPAL